MAEPVEDGPLRIVVADDHPVYRDGLAMLLDSVPGLTVVGTAADGEAAVALARQEQPDVVVMDVRMPGIGGIEAAVRIRDAFPDVVLVFMTIDLSLLPDGDRERMAGWPQVEKRLLRPSMLASLWQTHRQR